VLTFSIGGRVGSSRELPAPTWLVDCPRATLAVRRTTGPADPTLELIAARVRAALG